jgi:hypothetical protein
VELLVQADVVVAEVTQPSLGVGYEIGESGGCFETMRPKARWLAQHGGPRLAGWRKSDTAGVILYVMDGPYRLPFTYRTVLPLQELYGCVLMEFPASVR